MVENNLHKKELSVFVRSVLLFLASIAVVVFSLLFTTYSGLTEKYSVGTVVIKIPVKNYSFSVSEGQFFPQAEANRSVSASTPLNTRSHFIPFAEELDLQDTVRKYPFIISRYFRNLFLFFISINAP